MSMMNWSSAAEATFLPNGQESAIELWLGIGQSSLSGKFLGL
jgi:hypothetical protein